jgi:XRE family aerobic/anaerobic benzoate catabolism transcriptional regulator|tara:strand:+ start:14879 stop:15778 length:900 start_codon:yes stop_codon:yes gene_type:complete
VVFTHASHHHGQEEAFLARLGQRIRNLRLRMGITRTQLSDYSEISTRYLAQIETGKGNPSIRRLRQLAAAMQVPLSELVCTQPLQDRDRSLLSERLAALSPAQLRQVGDFIDHHIDGHVHKQGGFALLGVRGAGKSTLGMALAEKTSRLFVRLTEETEKDAGMSTDEIHALSGQAAYRRAEQRALVRIRQQHEGIILEAGGGIINDPVSFNYLLTHYVTIWLQARPEDHMQRVLAQKDFRPMEGNPEALADLTEMLNEREPYYQLADVIINTSELSEPACIRRLLEIVRLQPGKPSHRP